MRAWPAASRAVVWLAAWPALAMLAAACGEPTADGTARGELSLVGTLGEGDTAGYARATEPQRFVFPDDHGPHPEYRTEWWYVTGNLMDRAGRPFGFQLTIFRNALAPVHPGGPSTWATNQAYMGHFTLTDVAAAEFHAFELFARGAGGLAGARADPFRVWIEDWALETSDPQAVPGSSGPQLPPGSSGSQAPSGPPGPGRSRGTGFPMSLSADGDGIALQLTLESAKPVVLQGEDGLSRKGPEPGNASYYYAHTRLPARGRLVLAADTLEVSGLAWLDREWSTSALSTGQVGWDWFALQLDDGWDVMVYRLRHGDGSADPLSEGVLIDPEGRRHSLAWGRDIIVEETGTWTSPTDEVVYPSGWRVRVPGRAWDLQVSPAVENQELTLAFRYWEGAVTVGGVGEGGSTVGGRGYVELTGYAEEQATR